MARIFNVSRAAIHETSKRWDWSTRAKFFDEYQAMKVCPAPDRLQEAAAASPVTPVVTEEVRAMEREFLTLIELYRSSIEALGKAQLSTARGMTEKARRSVAVMLQDDKPLSASQLPGFVSAATTLAAAAQHTWGRSIGVDRLLEQMAQAVATVDATVIQPTTESDRQSAPGQ